MNATECVAFDFECPRPKSTYCPLNFRSAGVSRMKKRYALTVSLHCRPDDFQPVANGRLLVRIGKVTTVRRPLQSMVCSGRFARGTVGRRLYGIRRRAFTVCADRPAAEQHDISFNYTNLACRVGQEAVEQGPSEREFGGFGARVAEFSGIHGLMRPRFTGPSAFPTAPGSLTTE
jgi:hypothetical protein